MTDERSTWMFRLTNTRTNSLRIVLEPWGAEGDLEPGATATVRVGAPGVVDLELEIADHEAVFYAGPGSLMSVSDSAGQTVVEGVIPVPGVPPGMTTRQFLDRLFRPPERGPQG